MYGLRTVHLALEPPHFHTNPRHTSTVTTQLYNFPRRREDFLRWMHKLPDTQTPAWLGLPNNADQVILQTKATTFVQKLLKMQAVTDDEDLAYQE
jgi:hypothetical protein